MPQGSWFGQIVWTKDCCEWNKPDNVQGLNIRSFGSQRCWKNNNTFYADWITQTNIRKG